MSDDFKGSGYSQPSHPERGAIEVYRHPARKSIALGLCHGNASHILAYFRNEESALEFMAWMSSISGKEGSE